MGLDSGTDFVSRYEKTSPALKGKLLKLGFKETRILGGKLGTARVCP